MSLRPETLVSMLRARCRWPSHALFGTRFRIELDAASQTVGFAARPGYFPPQNGPGVRGRALLGAYYGGCDQQTAEAISRYSESLGIAYQIRDDLEDIDGVDEPDDIMAMRPSLPLAVLLERTKAKPEQKALVEKAWRRTGAACRNSRKSARSSKSTASFRVVKHCKSLIKNKRFAR